MKNSKNITSTKIKKSISTFNTNRIITDSIKTISETIQIGQRIRNGANRFYEVTEVNENEITITDIQTDKTNRFPLSSFAQLFIRKHFDQLFTSNHLVETHESQRIGSDRFTIKHPMKLW